MINPFSWYHSLYYGEKWNLSDFDTKNPQSLDYLLKQMYMLGYRNGYLEMKNSLPALNAAYYVAVAIANTEGIDETNVWGEINSSIREIWEEDFRRYHKDNSRSNEHCPFAELMLIKWMVYAILWLQESKTDEMESFLDEFGSDLMAMTPFSEDSPKKMMEEERFLEKIPEMISKWEYRYNNELKPHPLHPQYYRDSMWNNEVSKYSMNDMIWQLSFFPSPQEQHAFLDWAKEMSDKYKFEATEDMPF